MTELILALITNMSVTFAACIIVIVAAPTIIAISLRAMRVKEAITAAKEEVRSQELNQINNRLRNIDDEKNRRITYLEGIAQGKTGERQ